MDFSAIGNNLGKHGYKISIFDTAIDAADYITDTVKGKTVAFGGSITLQDMKLYEKLSENNDVVWHWQPKENQTADDARKEARNAQVYFSSVNAIACTGEIVNIDGSCNRIAEIFYGHEKVYLVVGKNKITEDLSSAIHRARNVASPLNAQRLNRNTPCAVKADKCYDCDSDERICRGMSVILDKPSSCEYEIIFINENMGY
ncbi:MAG: lactate utilization protein [Anaerofustis stercorihominis]|nr:lactate utilization protein [Anaerofustis stercorihominis]